MVGRDVELAVLCRIPEDAIGDQVAEVGLLGADAGVAVAVDERNVRVDGQAIQRAAHGKKCRL